MSDAQVAVTTSLRAKSGREDALVHVLRGLAEAVRREETGCIHYLPVRSQHEPSHFVLFERYRDGRALSDHANSSHLRDALPRLMDCLTEPPELRIYDVLHGAP